MWLLKQNKPFYHFSDQFFDFPGLSKVKSLENKWSEFQETDNDITLSLAIPGLKKEDIKIEFKDGYAIVESTLKNQSEKDQFNEYEHTIFNQSPFKQTFYIGDIDQENIQANLNHGILTIKFPKKEEQKPQLISIS